jgi:putative DNA methylase
MLSTKAGKVAYVEPVIDDRGYRFTVKVGMPQDVETTKRGTKLGSSGSSFYCLMSGTPMPFEYLRQEAKDGRMGARLMAIVAEGDRGRVYLTPTPEMEAVALSANPLDVLETYLPQKALGFRIQEYGMKQWRDLFTPRQLKALTTFSDLVQEAREKVKTDALASGMNDDCQGLDDGGLEATAYADAVSVYLAFAVSKTSNRASTLCTFKITVECPGDTFGRQALSMTWDYAEANIVAGPSGSFESMLANTVAGILSTAALFVMPGVASQADASKQTQSSHKIVSTDPPYYDNIGYADLSDFFYVWLRRSLKPVFPDLFATLAVPKAEELVATAYRHGSKGEAEAFFLDGMTQAMQRLAEQSHPAFPVTIYYAFKQTESDGVNGVSNSGWETFLDAVIRAGFAITGTWPVRTERENRKRNQDSNALASSIVLVCRKRVVDAHTISRREYIRELNAILPEALDEMTKGSGNDVSPVAPVDLSQAIIGPGMAVFTKYASVLEADGSPMTVHTALQLINRFLAEDDFDADTRFCLHWFEQNGWSAGRFGDADTLSRAKGTSVDGVANAGIIESGGGNVRLLKWSEYSSDWDPTTDTRNPIWETLHHLIRSLKQDGETAAGRLLSYVKSQGESVRQLAYRLYTLCERQGWAEDARAYNELITSWSGIESASVVAPSKLTQVGLI